MFGMLIISFGLWGIGDMLRAGGGNSEVGACRRHPHPTFLAGVGGTSVPVEDVRQRFNLQLEQIQRQTGQRPEPEQALRYGLHIRALEDVVQRAVIDNAMQQYGLVVGDAEVQSLIAKIPPSRASAARSTSSAMPVSCSKPASPRLSTSPTCAARSPSAQLFGTVRTEWPRPHGPPRRHLQDGKRAAVWRETRLRAGLDTSSTVPKPTAEQLNTYFDANKNKFQIPEFRSFSYVLLTRPTTCWARSRSPPTRSSRSTTRTRATTARPKKRDVDQRDWPTARTGPRRS